MKGRPGQRIGLWWLCAPIAVWMLHFVAVYVVASIRCARAGAPFASLAGARGSILAATLLAVVILAVLALRGHRACDGHYLQRAGQPAEDQDRFLGSMLVLLSASSMVAALAVASVSLVFGDCR